MNSRAARIGKEARALFWAWCVLFSFGVVALGPAGSFTLTFLRLRPIAFWVGIPLLATLSLGHEFQHGTMSLLLAQPLNRMKIWGEKWIVLAPAVVTVAFVNLWDPYGLFWLEWQTPLIAVVWMVIAVCSATFWTLVGRSTINGFVLNILQGVGMFMAWQLVESFRNPLVVVAALGYSFLMLWLGGRKLARFEVAGGSASTDLLTAGPRATRGPFAGLLRCRPAQPIFNLIRKELRLLWLVGLLILVSILGVLCIAVFRLVPGVSIAKLTDTMGAFILALALLSAVLTGSLSMGEERTLGTQSSNRMLPVSARVQWLLKLAVILFVPSLALALPVAVAQLAFGWDFVGHFDVTLSLFLVPSLLSVVAFFCASALKGTVRAALLVVPAIAVIYLAGGTSFYFVEGLMARMLDAGLLRFHPFPFTQEYAIFRFRFRPDLWLVAIALLPMLILSYRLFRREIQESFRPAASSLLWVALVVFLFGTALGLPAAVVRRAEGNMWRTLGEMREATAKLPSDLIPPGAPNPRQFTVEELSKSSALSETSRSLLRDATILVNRNPDGAYLTTTRFRNGVSCTTDGIFWCAGRLKVTGRLVVDGKPAAAAVQISLRHANYSAFSGAWALAGARQRYSRQYQSRIDSAGSFSIDVVPVPEGRYRFEFVLPDTAYIADIRQGSVSVYDNGILVRVPEPQPPGAQELEPVDVLVGTDAGNINGTVRTPDRTVAVDSTVVLAPPQNRRRNPALYKTARTDSEGRFNIRGVPPGAYKLFAWESVPLPADQHFNFLRKYEERGIPVVVNASSRATVELSLISLTTAKPRRN